MPIIEETSLFARSVGTDTDIVKKQMYAFKDQGERDICLRPEATASVARAYIEHHLDRTEGLVKLYYMGPMFRNERPQAARLRQFHQAGVELIGSYSPYADAEVIILLCELLKAYGLKDPELQLNSLGCENDKQNMRQGLSDKLKPQLKDLCEDCGRRYKTNILRVLDCKNPECKKVIGALAEVVESSLCKACSDDLESLKKVLTDSGVSYTSAPFLVRGLDYYTKTVFEVTAKDLGAQDAVAAGGRYDNLISDLGGPKAGACGFAIGIERVIEALSKSRPDVASEDRTQTVFIVTLGDAAYKKGFGLLLELRSKGISTEIDLQGRSLKAQMRYADRLKAGHVIIIGDDELKSGQAVVKKMSDGSQQKVSLSDLASAIKPNK